MRELRLKYPRARIRHGKFGGGMVTIPDFPLPHLWNKQSTTVKFKLADGYPFSPPLNGFVTDHDLRRSNNGMTAMVLHVKDSSVYGDDNAYLRFYWRPQHWRAQKDTIMTFVRLIKIRLHMDV